jgi:hypothetical protein
LGSSVAHDLSRTSADEGQDHGLEAMPTYSNGDVVSWIQTVVKRALQPEHLAPFLHLTKRTSD